MFVLIYKRRGGFGNYNHLFLRLLPRFPHIRLYHTMVPCNCWGSPEVVGRAAWDAAEPIIDSPKDGVVIPEKINYPTKIHLQLNQLKLTHHLVNVYNIPRLGATEIDWRLNVLPVCRDGPPSMEWGFTTIAVLLEIMGGLFSSGGVTSSPMLSFSAILMGFWNFVEKCDNPMSSKLLFLRGLPMFGSPCLSELDLEIFVLFY